MNTIPYEQPNKPKKPLSTAQIEKRLANVKLEHPLCRYCSKPLRRHRWRDNPAWKNSKTQNTGWGDYGDGLFCGHRCGYNWAVAKAGP